MGQKWAQPRKNILINIFRVIKWALNGSQMGFAQWAAYGLWRGLKLGPIWASPLETKWDQNGLNMGFQVGTRWAQSGLSLGNIF